MPRFTRTRPRGVATRDNHFQLRRFIHALRYVINMMGNSESRLFHSRVARGRHSATSRFNNPSISWVMRMFRNYGPGRNAAVYDNPSYRGLGPRMRQDIIRYLDRPPRASGRGAYRVGWHSDLPTSGREEHFRLLEEHADEVKQAGINRRRALQADAFRDGLSMYYDSRGQGQGPNMAAAVPGGSSVIVDPSPPLLGNARSLHETIPDEYTNSSGLVNKVFRTS